MQSSFTRVLSFSLPPGRRRRLRLPSRTCVSAIWSNKRKELREEGEGGRRRRQEKKEVRGG